MAEISEEKIIKLAQQTISKIENRYKHNGENFIRSLTYGYDWLEDELSNTRGIDMSIFQKLREKVISSLEKYSQGNIDYVFRSMSLWWSSSGTKGKDSDKRNSRQDIINKYGIIFRISRNIVMYRMRKGSLEDNYGKSDMFVVPFAKRRILSNYRFSVSGYPCLYTGLSLYGCWEELRRPSFDNIYATQLRCVGETSINLLDLRLVRKLSNQTDISSYIQILPLIIACSIPVPKEYDSNKFPFKLEYAFPQFLMNAITQKTRYVGNAKISGIIYTSTQCKGGIHKVESPKCDNIAILVPSEQKEMSFAQKFEIKAPVHINYAQPSSSINNNFSTLETLLNNLQYEKI